MRFHEINGAGEHVTSAVPTTDGFACSRRNLPLFPVYRATNAQLAARGGEQKLAAGVTGRYAGPRDKNAEQSAREERPGKIGRQRPAGNRMGFQLGSRGREVGVRDV